MTTDEKTRKKGKKEKKETGEWMRERQEGRICLIIYNMFFCTFFHQQQLCFLLFTPPVSPPNQPMNPLSIYCASQINPWKPAALISLHEVEPPGNSLYLSSFSAEEAKWLWISGEHFHRSLLGAGSSLTESALTSFFAPSFLFIEK